jgi:DNA-binding CsgD family transcriptional regulator
VRCSHALAALFAALNRDEHAALAHLEAAEPEPALEKQGPVTQRLRRLCAIYAGFAQIYLGRGGSARRCFGEAVRRDEKALAWAGLQLSHLGANAGIAATEPIAGELEAAGQGGFARLLRSAAAASTPDGREFGLSPAESEVLRELAAGVAPKKIALHSGRSIETVRNHVKSAIRKLGVSGSLEAIAAARSAGLI